MIDISHLAICFQGRAVFSDFSLSLAAGEKAVLAGRSGSGKSTLLNALMGFVPADAGDIRVDGLNLGIETIDEIRGRTAWLPQELGIKLDTAGELFYYPYTFKRNRSLRPEADACADMLARLELSPDILETPLGNISGGQKQRILAASLLLMSRPVMLFDEPTSALDERSSGVLLEVVKGMEEATVLAATHDRQWQQGFDRIVPLDGSEAGEGPGEE